MSGEISSGHTAAAKWDGGVFALAAAIAPVLAVFAPLGMMPLAATLAVFLLGADMAHSRGWPSGLIETWRSSLELRRFTLLCALLWAWMLASIVWAVVPRQSLQACLQIGGLILTAHVVLAAALRFDDAQRRGVLAASLAGLAIAFGLYAVERLGDAPIGHRLHTFMYDVNETIFSPYNRGLTVALLLSFAAAACLLRKTSGIKSALAALALLGALIVAITFYFGSSLQIALIAGLAAALLTLLLPTAGPWLICTAVAVYVAIVPLIPPQVTPKIDIVALSEKTGNVSIAHRLLIWQFAAERIADKPLTGWGINSARAIPGGKDMVVLSYENGAPSSRGERLPLHTHNAALQWWLELGLPGAILMAGLWLLAFSRLARHGSRGARAAACGAATGAFAIANLSYGAWQSWWLATLTLAAAMLVMALREDGATHAGGRHGETDLRPGRRQVSAA